MVGAKTQMNIKEGLEAVKAVIEDAGKLDKIPARYTYVSRVYILGCGSSYWLAYYMACLLREGGFDALALVSSVFYFENYRLDKKSLVIAFSQSGETSETISALEKAKSAGAQTLAIVNQSESTIAKMVDIHYMTPAGSENILATKSFDAAMCVAYILARSFIKEAHSDIIGLPTILRRSMRLSTEPAVSLLKDQTACYVIGMGIDLVGAGECAVKLGEGALVQASAMPATEISHGPKANANAKTVIVVAMQLKYNQLYTNVIDELKGVGANVIVFAPLKVDYPADVIYELSGSNEIGIFGAVKLAQRIAVDTAIAKSLDPDFPPALKKFVVREDLN